MAKWEQVLQPKTSPAEAEVLRDLKHHPGWPVLMKLIRGARNFALNEALSRDRGEWEKGLFEGLTRSMVVIDWAIADAVDDPALRKQAFPNELVDVSDLEVRP